MSEDTPLDRTPEGFTPRHVLEENQRRHGDTFGAGEESNAHTLHEQMAKLLYSHGGDTNEIEEDIKMEALLKDCAHAKVVESNRWTTAKAEQTLLDKTFAMEAMEEMLQTILHRNSVTCRSKTKGYTARATDEPGIHYYSCSSPTRVNYHQHDDYESGEDQESGDEESGDEDTAEFSLADVHDHSHATVSANLEALVSGQRQHW
jgi:hypothetical protein